MYSPGDNIWKRAATSGPEPPARFNHCAVMMPGEQMVVLVVKGRQKIWQMPTSWTAARGSRLRGAHCSCRRPYPHVESMRAYCGVMVPRLFILRSDRPKAAGCGRYFVSFSVK